MTETPAEFLTARCVECDETRTFDSDEERDDWAFPHVEATGHMVLGRRCD